jgi:predicted amidohydrolase
MEARHHDQMIGAMLARMEEVVCLQPDVVCLPEVFPFANLSGGRPPVADVAEKPIGPICRPFAEFARKHRCYVVCPVYTEQDGRYYNAAVFIDRAGDVLGEYRKMHPTIGEMENAVAPGPLDPPVFQADFGTIGAQICFDIEWLDGWQRLSEAGAEIVFWPSAFAGGSMVNTKAWQNKYCVVSSTRKGTTKICDLNGEEIAWTGQFARWVCAPVNLEKALLHTWPYCRRFNDIRAKYGRKVRIKTFHEEEWTVIESRSADVKIADVMKEFELKTHKEHIRAAQLVQNARRR